MEACACQHPPGHAWSWQCLSVRALSLSPHLPLPLYLHSTGGALTHLEKGSQTHRGEAGSPCPTPPAADSHPDNHSARRPAHPFTDKRSDGKHQLVGRQETYTRTRKHSLLGGWNGMRSHVQRVLTGNLSPACAQGSSRGAGREGPGEEGKWKDLLLPPADTGAVHPRGVSAITICNGRGRHWGIGTCWWFWRGSKISARRSAWSGREKQKQCYWLCAQKQVLFKACLRRRCLLKKHMFSTFSYLKLIANSPFSCYFKVNFYWRESKEINWSSCLIHPHGHTLNLSVR